MEILSQDERLLATFKALADASRLKIVGLLAQRAYTVEQLASLLNLRPSTVSHHLSRLSEAGLVSARAESYYNIYQLEQGALDKTAQMLLKREGLSTVTAGVDYAAFDRKVLRDFLLPDGRLKTIPAQRKKREVILRHILQAFKPGSHYSEKEVGEILQRFHSDTATLRRELIGYRMLARQKGEYWRLEEEVKDEHE